MKWVQVICYKYHMVVQYGDYKKSCIQGKGMTGREQHT